MDNLIQQILKTVVTIININKNRIIIYVVAYYYDNNYQLINNYKIFDITQKYIYNRIHVIHYKIETMTIDETIEEAFHERRKEDKHTGKP